MAWRFVLAVCLALPLSAAEYVVLSNGFRLHAEKHERSGDRVLLHTPNGVIEMSAAEVTTFEPEDYIAPPVAPQPAATLPAAPTMAPAPVDAKRLINEAADRWGLPAELVHSVAKAESAYRTDAVSPKGALGVMQLMPATAQALNADPKDPAQNIDAGVRLLRDLLQKYDGSAMRALAAYNAGSGAVDRYKTVPPYRETQLYVRKVLDDFNRQKKP